MHEILSLITEGKGQIEHIEMLEHLASVMKSGALCALGRTASNPVLSTIRYFRDEYEAHIKDKKCPAKVCKALITYSIIEDKCPGCGLCVKNCPQGAIESRGKKVPVVLHQEKCEKCGICYDVCKLGAIEVPDTAGVMSSGADENSRPLGGSSYRVVENSNRSSAGLANLSGPLRLRASAFFLQTALGGGD